MGDDRAPILTYKIQYNTSFTPDTWETATGFDADKNRFTGLERESEIDRGQKLTSGDGKEDFFFPTPPFFLV